MGRHWATRRSGSAAGVPAAAEQTIDQIDGNYSGEDPEYVMEMVFRTSDGLPSTGYPRLYRGNDHGELLETGDLQEIASETTYYFEGAYEGGYDYVVSWQPDGKAEVFSAPFNAPGGG